MSHPVPVAVCCDNPETGDAARALAHELSLPPAAEDALALLEICPDGLSLVPQGKGAPGPVRVDFEAPAMRHRRRGGHNEPLGRAVGVTRWPGLEIVDATAGLGRDSFVLADLGARVTLLERHPVLFALLRDGLERGLQSSDAWVADVCSRMQLYRAEATLWLTPGCADVVYLDPMFPARRKSARVKKEMWLFQQLLEQAAGPLVEEQGLLEAALAAARRRVVVKRPAKAPPLEDRVPGFDIPGKTVRFDVYPARSGS